MKRARRRKAGLRAGAAIAIALALATSARSPEAHAGPCPELVAPVYVTGSSAAKPLLAELAKVLAAASPRLTVVYQGAGSCSGLDAFFGGAPITGPITYWDPAAEQTCELEGPGAPIDVAISDVYATTCDPSYTLSETIDDFMGPVQTMTFVVPNASKETSISAEAAYFVYGFGAASGVAPWTDPAYLFQRGPGSGTQRMIGAAIGVPASSFLGALASSSDDLKDKVAFAADADATLGILAADVAEASATLKVLAYQHYDQACGYYPDADGGRNDKRNVRDGHYAIWGNLHLLAHANIATGEPLIPGAAAVIDYLTGRQRPPGGLDLIRLEAQHHVVPTCAMRVQRVAEMGPLASFMPVRSCSCYYDAVATGEAACAPCSDDGDCSSAAPRCSFGYCEPR